VAFYYIILFIEDKKHLKIMTFTQKEIDKLLLETNVTKDEIAKVVKDVLKNDRNTHKDLEKKVKSLVAASVNTLFRTLWQRRNFYEDEIKK
jgi:polyhydroxyalkanoate synthesis regulator phasin